MIRCWRTTAVFVALAVFGAARSSADLVKVRYPQGTAHGFLVLRDMDGKLLATGESIATMHGGRITSRLVFRFHDGSLDDDVATYTQKGEFHLLHEHHVQRGPTFPTASDMTVDVPTGQVELHESTKDGKQKVTKQHMDLPPDLVNGFVLTALENLSPSMPTTTLNLLVPYNGARVIHLVVTPAGTMPFHIMGSVRQAKRFHIQVELGGMTGVVAPLVGKQPKDADFLVLEGVAPAFVREEGQFFQDGPVWRIEQVGPTMP